MKTNKSYYYRLLYHSVLTTGLMPLVNMKLTTLLTFIPSSYCYLMLYCFTPVLTSMLFSLEKNNDETPKS